MQAIGFGDSGCRFRGGKHRRWWGLRWAVETFGQPVIADYRTTNVATAMRALGFSPRFVSGLAIDAGHRLERTGAVVPEDTPTARFSPLSVAG